MPRLDLPTLPVLTGTGYPPPHDRAVGGRSRIAVAAAGGLTAFGANLVTLQPGSWSSQRHWHSAEDEMVLMLEGELVLVEETGEAILRPGDIATFKAGEPNGHHLQNRSSDPARFVSVGPDLPETDVCHYPDIGMRLDKQGFSFPQNS